MLKSYPQITNTTVKYLDKKEHYIHSIDDRGHFILTSQFTPGYYFIADLLINNKPLKFILTLVHDEKKTDRKILLHNGLVELAKRQDAVKAYLENALGVAISNSHFMFNTVDIL